jgi:2-polyprenyl-3-methyl-5-hydroxy-6-metoxy-1,4-benzoquinol methylase
VDIVGKYYNSDYPERTAEMEMERGDFRKLESLWPGDYNGGPVLDVGCGTGAITWKLADSGLTVAGLDLSETFLKRASARGLHAAAGDAHALPFRPGVFGAVIALDTIEHLFMPRVFMAEVRRVMAPGGIFILEIPNHFNIFQRKDMLLGHGIVHYHHRKSQTTTDPWSYPHIRFPSLHDVYTIVEESGFRIEMIQNVQLGPWDFHRFNIVFQRYRVREMLANKYPALFAFSWRLRLRVA